MSSGTLDIEEIQRQARSAMRLPAEEIACVNTRIFAHLQKRSYLVHMLRIIHNADKQTCDSVTSLRAFCAQYELVERHRSTMVEVPTLSYALHCNRDLHEYVMGLVAYFTEHNLHATIMCTKMTITPKPKDRVLDRSLGERFLASFSIASPVRVVQVPQPVFTVTEYLLCLDLAVSNLDKIVATIQTDTLAAATREIVEQHMASPRPPPPLSPTAAKDGTEKSGSASAPLAAMDSTPGRSRRISLVRPSDRDAAMHEIALDDSNEGQKDAAPARSLSTGAVTHAPARLIRDDSSNGKNAKSDSSSSSSAEDGEDDVTLSLPHSSSQSLKTTTGESVSRATEAELPNRDLAHKRSKSMDSVRHQKQDMTFMIGGSSSAATEGKPTKQTFIPISRKRDKDEPLPKRRASATSVRQLTPIPEASGGSKQQ